MDPDKKEKLDKLEIKLINTVFNKVKIINNYIQRWPHIFYTVVTLVITLFLLFIIFYNHSHPINGLSTWIGSFGSIFAVIVALYLSRNQPKMKVGTDVLVSENYVIAYFLNRRKSDGFIRAESLSLYDDTKPSLKLITVPKRIHEAFPSDWQKWRSVSSTKPLELLLYDKNDYNNNLQNLYDYFAKIYSKTEDVDFKKHPIETCAFGITFITNDYSPNITVLISVSELISNGVIAI